MRIAARMRSRQPDPRGVAGVARVDRRTKQLTKRLQAGDVAIIDHEDLDRVAAEALVAAGVTAVVNAAASSTGRYPNLGPAIVVGAGIPLLDAVGPDVLTAVPEGSVVRLEGDRLLLEDREVARGTVLDAEAVAEATERARAGLSEQLEAFAENTMQYLRRERDLLFDGVGVPDVRTEIDGRQVLIVVRGYHYREDLQALRPYIREFHPILLGVDGGADALLEAGYVPDMIVGDMDSVSDSALTSGAELIVHAYRDGFAPGVERLERLGLEHVIFPATGTSEDVAMLLADDKGANLIVAVGTHATLVEFLDKGRAGMASTFLTRLRIGGKLIDAKGVSRLYRSRISNVQIFVLVLAGLLALLIALASTPTGQLGLSLLRARWDDLAFWVHGLVT